MQRNPFFPSDNHAGRGEAGSESHGRFCNVSGGSRLIDESYSTKGPSGHLRRAIEFNIERSGAQGLPCGLHADWNDCIPAAWPGFEVTRSFRGATYHITAENPDGRCKDLRSLSVDGEPVEGNRIPPIPAGATARVVARL